jgi:hypothetical protein
MFVEFCPSFLSLDSDGEVLIDTHAHSAAAATELGQPEVPRTYKW